LFICSFAFICSFVSTNENPKKEKKKRKEKEAKVATREKKAKWAAAVASPH
jgi:Na+-transporting methylmalonyl-CoA/oxaloacetate decarboxylase gamma subunit